MPKHNAEALEKRLHHPAAHRARQAHRIIRLREQGWEGDAISDLPEIAVEPVMGSHDIFGGASTRPLARLISSVHDGVSVDRPGPTDPATAEFCCMDRPELFRIWEEMTSEACSELDPDGFAAAQESQARDREARTAADAGRRESGLWVRDEFVPHGSDIPYAANALYDLGREGFLAGEIDADTASIKLVLVDSGLYAIDLASHKFLSSIASGARVATSGVFTGKSVAAGVFDAADLTYTGLTGASVELLVLVQSSAVTGGADVADTAQRLILAIDTATGLPFTPAGTDVSVTWDNSSGRIFKL